MTLFFPDISSYEAGLKIQPSTVAVIAKATEGIGYSDAYYADFKKQAAAVGALFSGYHFLRSDSDPAAQAAHYFSVAGSTPCMLDVETTGSSKPGVNFVVSFMEALKSLGGRVWGVYFPQWYWGEVGGDLSRVTALGAVLVASAYRGYSDSDWPVAYGGAVPRVWQYTNAQSYGGQSVDFNAFKGTASELSAIINGDDMDPSTPLTFPAYAAGWWPDIAKDGGVWTGQETANDVWTLTAARVGHIVHVVENLAKSVAALSDKVNTLQGGVGVSPQAVAAETLAELKAKL